MSQDDLLDVPCDEDDLHDDIYVIPMQSLKNDHAICVLKSSTCAENRLVIHNASEVDELKLLSFLNTLGFVLDQSVIEQSPLSVCKTPTSSA